MSISGDYSLADIAAATGNNNGNNNGMGWGGDWSAWIIIFLIFAAFGWGGNGNGLFGGGGPRGAADSYVLASDFSMLSRQMSDGFASQERKLDSISNGLCDGFYAQAQLANGINMNVMQGNNALASQISQCLKKIKSKMSNLLNAKYAVGTCAA